MNTFNVRFPQLAILAFAALSALAASGATWHVDASRPDDTGDGTSWPTAKQKLESGVALAGATGTVLVADGIYSPAAEVLVNGAVTVSSVNGAEFTFVNGGGAHRCFNISHTNALVEGFTLTNGYVPAATSGGGVIITKGRMRNCRLFGNISAAAGYAGGGAYVSSVAGINFGIGIIEGCLISNNMAPAGGAGGGLFVDKLGQALNCTSVCNSAKIGAGIYMNNGGTISGCVVRANQTNGVAVTTADGQPTTVIWDCVIDGNTGLVAGTSSGGGLSMSSAGGTAVVVNCTISNNWEKTGGGVSVGMTSVKFEDCRIVGNTANGGGGVNIKGKYVTFTNCLIANNVVTTNGFATAGTEGGGGVLINSAGTSVFYRCIISGNLATNGMNGGGLTSLNGGPCFLLSCTIESNRTDNSGGGFSELAYGGLASNCVIRGNHASSAGGGGSMTKGKLFNCVITGNTSGNQGGGLVFSGGTVDCCTVVGNAATNNAGGINASAPKAWIANSIIVSNFAASATTKDFRFQSNSQSSLWYSCYGIVDVAPPAGQGNINANPAFCNYTNGNFRLSKGSPCINAGTNEPWMDTSVDFDGRPRIQQSKVDMGAFEYRPQGTCIIIR